MTAKSSYHAEKQTPSFLAAAEQHSGLFEILRKFAQNAIELLELADCAIILADEQGMWLVPATTSLPDVLTEVSVPASLFPEHGSIMRVLEQGEPLILDSVSYGARMQPLPQGEVCALACLPMTHQETSLGIVIASSAPGTFTEKKLRQLTLVAEQLALALINARQAVLVQDANRMKGNFLSMITHELRSPLNAINGYLDLALTDMAGELNEQQREFIARARAGSEHLYALLEDLLLASRADAGQLRLNRESTVLEDIVSEALEELELSASDAGVALETHLAADLPELYIDPVRVRQVLRNLLSNALHFTQAGGRVVISARVLEAAEEQKELVEIGVQDNGCGIQPVYHGRIFERFFQVPRSDRGRASGQGLGLAIVKMIVELHGGQVQVESSPGHGSTFLFTLATS